jgi:predicted nucleotidyltransferase component of viral defense system
MQALQNLEVIEIEILEKLNSVKVLDNLYFGGGTMLRLCHNLNRYSTDLDFWLDKKSDAKIIYKKCKDTLASSYQLTDSMNKKHTLLFEIKPPEINRRLKIEIRKEQIDFDWERKIAFSKFANNQVLVKGLTLEQMMRNKIDALLSRKLIRDAFDIEFLLMRGIELPTEKDALKKASVIINNFTRQEYKVILGSILEQKERKYYLENKFKFLKEELFKKINLSINT